MDRPGRTTTYKRVPARHRGGHRGYGTNLSPREREVVELVVNGRANKEIAAALFISIKTVETHVAAAMRKLGAPSRSAIAPRLSHHDQGVPTKSRGFP